MNMKVLIENDTLFGGGVEQIMYYLVEYLHQKGYAITIVTAKGDKNQFQQVYPNTVRFFPLHFEYTPFKRLSFPWLCQRLKWYLHRVSLWSLQRRHFDIAIAMKEGPCAQNILRRNANRKFAWVHVDYSFLHWTKGFFASNEDECRCFQSFEKVICVSHAAADALIYAIGNPGNLSVKYNPIPYLGIREKSTLPCAITKTAQRPLFVTIGRLAPEKQYNVLIDACLQLLKDYDFELWIIGDGPNREELEQQIGTSHASQIKILGVHSNPFPLLQQADCFISSSKAESFGLAIQEALVLGIPVLSTHCPAVEELLDSRFGMIVPNNAQGIQQGIKRLLTDSSLLTYYRQNIHSHFDTTGLFETRLQSICDLWEGQA